MAGSESRLRVRDEDGVTVVEFIDRNILDEANIQAIGAEMSTIIEARPAPRMVISFSNVDHLSSAALGTLITVNQRVKDKEGSLALADIDPQIHEVFVITRLNRIFSIHDSAEDAIKSIA